MALRPLEDIIGPLVVPIRGKEYTLPRVSLPDGIRLTMALRNEGTVLWADLIPMLLGDAYTEMMEDKIPPAMIDRVLWTALADFQNGRESAEAVWENGVPKAVLQELMTAVSQPAKPTSTGAESTTPPPAFTNGTTGPVKPKAARSRGKKSSTSSP
jgi:hypothetical protein